MKISVLTPSFNSENHIEIAIKSVLDQNYTSFEHIIIDGDSEDNTIKVLKKYEHLIWKSERDQGQSDAMNKAFNLATGDLIVYLNADDYFLPNAFKTIVCYFENDSKLDMVVGNLYVERNRELSTSTNSTVDYQDLRKIKGRFPLNPVSYFYRKKVQEEIGAFPINEHYTMDFWFLIRAFHKFNVLKIEDFLGVFVFSENNKTANHDSFKAQRSIALKFVLFNDPLRFFSSFKALHTHNRSTSTFKNLFNLFFKINRLSIRLKRKLKI